MKWMKNKKENKIMRDMFRSAFLTACAIDYAAVGSGLIDGVVISKLMGSECMAAEGIAHPVFSIAAIVYGMLMIGMQTLCTEKLGRGDVSEADEIFSLAMVCATVISSILSAVLFFGSDPVSALLGARQNCAGVLPYTSAYIKGLAPGIIPMMLCVVLASAVQLDGGGKLVRLAAAAGAVSDIALDLVAAYGNLGMIGIGLATSISYIINLGVLSIHFLNSERMLHFSLKKLPWKLVPKLCWLGSERAGRTSTTFFRTLILNAIMISVGGTLGMSALSIRNNLDRFIMVPAGAISSALSIIVGISYGQKDKEEIKKIGRLAHQYTVVYAVLVCVIFALFYKNIAGLYVSGTEKELKELAWFAIFCLGAGTVFATLVICRSAYLQSIRIMKKAHLVTGLRIVLQLISAYVCSYYFGIRGPILAFAVADILALFISFMLNFSRSKEKRKENMLQLPESFTLAEQDWLRLKLLTIEDVCSCSRQVDDFCKKHGISDSTSFKASLCIEELTSNIIVHGFISGKDNEPIDVFVRFEDGKVFFIVRDRCPRFDLGARIRLIESEKDPTANIGIKMIAGTAKEIRYVNIVRTNVVLITI